MAVDRDQVDSLGMQATRIRPTAPASATPTPVARRRIADNCDWTKLNVDKANQMLDDAGYKKGTDGIRTLKDGKPFQFNISVGSASSDWLSVGQYHLQEHWKSWRHSRGQLPDWSRRCRLQDGTFDCGIVWSNAGATPYEFYRGAMSPKR